MILSSDSSKMRSDKGGKLNLFINGPFGVIQRDSFTIYSIRSIVDPRVIERVHVSKTQTLEMSYRGMLGGNLINNTKLK